MLKCTVVLVTAFISLIFVVTTFSFALKDYEMPFIDKTSASTCTKFVFVESHGLLNYLGNVTFTVPHDFTGQWESQIETNMPFTFFGIWSASAKPDGQNKQVKLQSKLISNLRAGDRITFRFRISYSRNEPVPYITRIAWEGHQICGPLSVFAKMEDEMQADVGTRRKVHREIVSAEKQIQSFLYDLQGFLLQ